MFNYTTSYQRRLVSTASQTKKKTLLFFYPAGQWIPAFAGMTKLFITFILLLFIASCSTKTIDNKEKIMKAIPKSKKQTDNQKFGAWIFSKDGSRCYIYSFPVSSYGYYLERNIHYIQINDKKEISVLGGLPYKNDSKVKIDVVNINIFLDTMGDKAWVNKDEDFVIHYFLEHEDSIFFVYNEFTPINNKDLSAVDKYTMQGFTEAWQYMLDNCKVVPLEKIRESQE
ncbi:MAG: hypothetical protein LBQ34_01655 [Alphaproteobacteria bacterium]|jgi:hypothetical protein|nr:hypothetical protein [Alphaproteobacteria bacterium]